MYFGLFKSFLDKMKTYGEQIDQLEHSVLDERLKFKEVYERNIVLEREITERTEELNQANRSLLTLKHIWSTMNSSEPLSEVLHTVVNGLSDGLGYLYCFILQVYEHKDGPRLKVRIATDNSFAVKMQDVLPESIYSYDIPMSAEKNIIIQAIKTKTILHTKSFKQLFLGSIPDVENDNFELFDFMLESRSISILPIVSQDKPFGCLVAISVRNEISDTEKNFLGLFAGQIELAVTIAGLFEQVREQAITDGLTGLYNRRHFDQCLASEVDRALRLKQPFTLISLDLDHLKTINDTYGHSAGDAAIRHIGSVLKQNARSIDIPSRFGGEEFSVILPGIDVEGGMIAAERLRAAIEADNVEGVGKITASIGVATFLKHTESLGELFELVDQAMYRAKRNGRNQVQIATKQIETCWQQLAIDTFVDMLTKQHIPIPRSVSGDLVQKLKHASVHEKSIPDFIYYIVDSLAKTYDPMYQNGYTREKVEIVTLMAEEVGLDISEIDKLKLATLLYDMGNIMMPESILLKPGPLTDSEKAKVLEHPIIAAREILKPIKGAVNILPLVEHHHEHWDGTGYPGKLSGDDIPIGSRIIFIVDAYFAMISDRPYRKAMTQEEAIEVLKKGANTKWDAKLVEAFISVLEKQKQTAQS